MGKRIQVVLRDETEERLKRAIFETKGMKKGNISETIEEAVEDWIEKTTKAKLRQQQKKA